MSEIAWLLSLLLTAAGASLASADTTVPHVTPAAFVGDGPVDSHGGGVGDATRVTSLVAASDSVVRFVVGFGGTNGLPAHRLGPTRVEMLRGQRLVRIHLPPEVGDAAILDARFTEEFLRGAYVVRSLQDRRSLFVDLHLMDRPCLARARVDSLPAVVVVELKSGGPPFPEERFYRGPVGGVVVVSPLEEELAYPLEVRGYARTFEAHVAARLRHEGAVVADTFTTASDYLSAWGEFRLGFASGPSGRLEITLAGDGPSESGHGRERGVTIPILVE